MELVVEFGRVAMGVSCAVVALSLGVVTVREIVHHYKTPSNQRLKYFSALKAPSNNYGRKLRY